MNQPAGAGQSKAHRADAVRWDGPSNPVYVGNNAALGSNGRGDVLTLSVFKSAGALIYGLGAWENGKQVDRTPQSSTVPTSARDINDSGVVPVGYSHRDGPGDGNTRAAAWRNGKLADLPLPKASRVDHRVVNSKGTTAGSLTPRDGTAASVAGTRSPAQQNTTRAVIWTGNGVTTLPGDRAGVADNARAINARAINERGDVVGWRVVDGVREAALWRDGQLVDLGTTGASEAVAVNDRGDVAGWQETSTGIHPFHWHVGTLIDLRTPTNLRSKAVDLNNSGVVIAHSGDFEECSRSYRWTVRY